MSSTKAEIKAEYHNLRELAGILLLARIRAERLEIAVERKQIIHDIDRTIQQVEFEAGVQHHAVELGHGRDE